MLSYLYGLVLTFFVIKNDFVHKLLGWKDSLEHLAVCLHFNSFPPELYLLADKLKKKKYLLKGN